MHSITVLAFGVITDILGTSRLETAGIGSTEELKEKLETQFPRLKNIAYIMAVNKQIATTSTTLTEGATVALLPPFSGG